MVGLRLAIVLVAVGAVAAHEYTLASFGHAIFEKAKEIMFSAGSLYGNTDDESRQNSYGEGDHQKFHHRGWHQHGDWHEGDHQKFHHGGWHQHGDWHHGDKVQNPWHQKMHNKMKEAHACHHKCGEDVACHAKCPKPWAPFVKACQDLPAIKACHASCTDAECGQCPKFEADWMNEKFAKNPEEAIRKAEAKCPMMLEAHACHEACTPGDHDCHYKCPRMFHWHDHGDLQDHGHWHHRAEHDDHDHDHKDWHKEWHHQGEHDIDDEEDWHQMMHMHQKMHNEMKEAHACHHKCGDESADETKPKQKPRRIRSTCHDKCPKPWAPFVKGCQDFPAIKACHASCKDAECGQCPKFEADWVNEKFAKNPETVIRKAEAKCPMLLENHACHKACTPGDGECHHKCGPPFGGRVWHHHGEHAGDDHKAHACHTACAPGDFECHHKCSPFHGRHGSPWHTEKQAEPAPDVSEAIVV